VRALIYDRLTRALFVGERFVAGAQSAGSYDSLNCIRVRKKRELRLLRRTTLFPRRFRELVASGTRVYFKLIPFLEGCRYLPARSRFVSRKPRDPSRYFIISNSRYRNSQLHSRNSACSSSTRKQASRESMFRICRRRSYVKRNYLKFSFNQFRLLESICPSRQRDDCGGSIVALTFDLRATSSRCARPVKSDFRKFAPRTQTATGRTWKNPRNSIFRICVQVIRAKSASCRVSE